MWRERGILLGLLTLTGLGLAGCPAASVDGRPRAPVSDVEIIDLMPAFWSAWEAKNPVERLRHDLIDAHPRLYSPILAGNPEFDGAEYLEQLRPLEPAMREVAPLFRAQIEATRALLESRVGPLDGVTIYIAPSLFSSNGQVRMADGKPVVMFGVDVQAYAELELLPAASRNELRAAVAHELLHARHYAVNPEARDVANALDENGSVPIYLNLWTEGLATCGSMALDGDAPIERALMSERLPVELPALLPRLAEELSARLDSVDVKDTADYFWLRNKRTDIPPRTAYGVGALVADAVVRKIGFDAALRLSGAQLHEEVASALRTLGSTTKVDWSRVCANPF